MLGSVPKRSFEHVGVLMGGWSAERKISLKSGQAVAQALTREGYRVSEIDVGRDVAVQLAAVSPDACFNALHGTFGEDGGIQGVLEALAIPYTHSGVLASAVAMDKELAKTILLDAGVPVAPAKLVTRREAASEHVLRPPYVVKPVADGSSFGVVIVDTGALQPPPEIAKSGEPDEVVMVERYVAGRELTCAVIGDYVSEIIEILPLKGLSFYDFEAKYAPGGSKHQLPAELSSNVYQNIRKYTLAAHKALGCRGVSRADFRFDEARFNSGDFDGALVCLEVNTQPGMTETSLVPELAVYAGWSFGELVRFLVEDASCERSKRIAGASRD